MEVEKESRIRRLRNWKDSLRRWKKKTIVKRREEERNMELVDSKGDI